MTNTINKYFLNYFSQDTFSSRPCKVFGLKQTDLVTFKVLPLTITSNSALENQSESKKHNLKKAINYISKYGPSITVGKNLPLLHRKRMDKKSRVYETNKKQVRDGFPAEARLP